MGLPLVKPPRFMTFLTLVGHLANFLVPAVVMAVILALMPRTLRKARAGRGGFWREVGWSSLAGTLVLVAGLVWFGRDGKMAIYAALVLVQGTLAWYWHGRGAR